VRASDIDAQAEAVSKVERAIALIVEAAPYTWRWGDGLGGWVLDELRTAIIAAGHEVDEPTMVHRKKDKIGRKLSKSVFERDAYRCVVCASHVDLCCDHIHPESKGGATSFDNLQTMCRPCNSKKGARL
jgi:hypothetical protein